MSLMVIGLNEDRFLVDGEKFEQVVRDSKEDWIKVTEWVEATGVWIAPEDVGKFGSGVNHIAI